MRAVSERPVLTDAFASMDMLVPAPNSTYLYGTSGEERSAHSAEWTARAAGVEFLPIVRQGRYDVLIGSRSGDLTMPLRGSTRLREYVETSCRQIVYLDITGLGHHVWAPLLRALLTSGREVRVVYVEPGEYRRHATPTEGELFALTERIAGLSPLPGFATLSRANPDFTFVPLLGFEGARLSGILNEVQPAEGRVVPIVGVPGFKFDYPFHTYVGNRGPLETTRAWRKVHFASANCPFSAYYALEQILHESPGVSLKVAPIGTKPHALGAILFAIRCGEAVELLYDHPIRKDKRTSGASRVFVYHVGELPS